MLVRTTRAITALPPPLQWRTRVCPGPLASSPAIAPTIERPITTRPIHGRPSPGPLAAHFRSPSGCLLLKLGRRSGEMCAVGGLRTHSSTPGKARSSDTHSEHSHDHGHSSQSSHSRSHTHADPSDGSEHPHSHTSTSHAHSHGIFSGHHKHAAEENPLVDLFGGSARKGHDDGGRAGVTVTLAGLATNVVFTLLKGFAGLLYNSASLLADAAHQASDLISDVVTLVAYRLSRKQADEGHPFGYGRYEALGALGVSGLLIAGAGATAWYSVDVLIHILQASAIVAEPASSAASLSSLPAALSAHADVSSVSDAAPAASTAVSTTYSPITLLTSFMDPVLHHSPHISHFPSSTGNPGTHFPLDHWALVLTALSIVAKEVLFRWTMRVGERERSSVLVANAWHHRSDAASSLVAMVGVGGSLYGWEVLDPIGGLLVSGMIVKYGLDTGAEALRELADASVPPDMVRGIEGVVAALAAKDSNVVSFADVRARKIGPVYVVDLDVRVRPTMSVSMASAIAENTRRAITSAYPSISEVFVDVAPTDSAPSSDSPSDTSFASATTPAPAAPYAGRPTSEIEGDVRRIVEEESGAGGVARGASVSHLVVHFLRDGLEVHLDVSVDDQSLTIRDAQLMARHLGSKLVDGIREVYSADVHLELTGHAEK